MVMQLIDTHAHIYLPQFATDRSRMLEEAEKNGITTVLMPAIDSETHEQLLQVENDFKICKAMMGLHPCSVNEAYKEELEKAETWLQQRNFIAIGETGLDFYWDTTFTEQQYAAFEVQIEWALQYQLPIVIHSRNATAECIKVVKQHPKLTGVFHCFSGTAAEAEAIVDLGFYLGIGGVLTFKNSGLDKAIQHIDWKHLVLETDAPYLAPVPYRGKQNEPRYLTYVAQKLAEVKNKTFGEIAATTTANAIKLFNLR